MSQQQLLDKIASMEKDGLVDSHFKLVHSLKEESGPFFMSDLITKYCSDTKDTLQEMTKLMEESSINFCKLEQLCLKLKGGTSCIGAGKVEMACADFRQATEDKSKDHWIGELPAHELSEP